MVRRPAQILGPRKRARLFSPAGAARPNLSARRAGPYPTGGGGGSATHHRLWTARAKLRQSRGAHRVGSARARGGDRQQRDARPKSAAPCFGPTLNRFFVIKNGAVEAARDEPDSVA